MSKLIFIQFCVLATVCSLVNGAGIWDSLVNVDRQSNGDRKVGVHLPFIYWMDLNRNNKGPKLDLSVLGGLVKVNVDRNMVAGKRPVMVRLLGQKLYNSYPEGVMPNNNDLVAYANKYQQAGASSDVAPVVKPSENVAEESAVTESKVYGEKPQESVSYDVPPTDSPKTTK